ncbi:MAG TPA: amidohydrolase family protein [Ktedonobacterales bacterium]|nr:amidohydrolase family protein [Ktedonobacterales bacterium]
MAAPLALLAARYVYPVAARAITDGAVAVEGERILAVGSATDLAARYPNARRIDLGMTALLPAAINAHTHLELTALRGAIAEELPMAEWIIALMGQRRALGEEALRASAAEGARQTLASGVAAIGEIATYGHAIAPVIESGLRGVIYLEALSGDPAQADATLERAKAQLARWQAEYRGAPVRFGLSLHAPYTVSAPLFERGAAWCRAEGVPLSIHAAESPAETLWLRDRSGPIRDTLYASRGLPVDLEPAPGVSPIRHLATCGALGAETLLAHGVQVDADDLALLHATRTALAHCPRSNTRLLNGRLPWAAYRAADVRLALGTDSLASAPSLSLWEEAAAALALHTAAGEPPDPAELLRLATLGGADALGLLDDLGSLEPGKLARFASAPLDQLGQFDAASRATPDAALRAVMSGRVRIGAVRL